MSSSLIFLRKVLRFKPRTAAAFNWFLAGRERVRRWVMPLERAAGTLLVVMGLLMVSGHYATLNRFLAGLGQLVNLEM